MTALILQTFFLAALAVGAGVVTGVLVKQWFGRRTVGSERLTEVMEAAAAEEAVAEAASAAATAAEPLPVVEETEVVAPVAAPDAIVPDVPEPPEVLTGPAAEVSAGLDRIAAADKVGDRPAYLPAPRDGVADNLRLIKGIGPQNEARLNFLGIYHIDQIASWTPSEVRWMGAYLSFPGRIEREDWIGQAKALLDEAQSAGGGTGA